ncbi:MAG: hypothetical protein K0U86_13485 [Planctomycetes bacterium]|nr:hypothetical protein [Planctomycetota bacterium]MCH9725904.1 hypothetical protein [Planctomycetota bacterium]MCH9777057.1 hypothetical protein [Planctomycetota bacterium]
MDSKISNDFNQFFKLITEFRFLYCAVLIPILSVLTGCASTECSYEETYSPISSRVKKCFLFHQDKCSPHPYRSLDGYQTDLDKLMVKHAAKKCAKQSLKTLACDCKEKPSKAFRDGYQQAYIDIALGDSGEVPPVPPEEYWAAHYRTPVGYLESQQWFTGYKLGAEHALADGRYDYNEIATPYSLVGWDQSQSGYWGENTNDQQFPTEPDTNQKQLLPAPLSNSQHTPPAPRVILPPTPGHQREQHLQPIPQRSNSERTQKSPLLQQQQIRPALPRQQIHNPQPLVAPPFVAPPLVAPKPPVRIPLPAPAANKHRPETQHSKPPVYINDDPPPNPYSLQSYPYTPLPKSQTQTNHHRSLEQSGAAHRLLRFPDRRDYGNRY